ncbi:MAG: PAS domain S-box protein [Gemmobacter sp.]|nr:PAS domain S-box protein [Gemmobacter sp.]
MTQSTPPTPKTLQARPINRALLADALLSSALDCIIVADDQGRILEFNEAAERTFGWSRADILGRTMDETIVPHHHRTAHRNGMARYLGGGKPVVIGRRVEVEGLHASGRIFPVELSIAEVNMDKTPLFVATLRDISTDKVVAAALHQARASLQAIFDSIPAGLYLRDTDDRLVMMNDWGARFLGFDVAEMLGQPMSRFREPQNTEGVRRADAEVLRTGKPVTQEFTYHAHDGTRVGHVTFFPVRDAKGAISHVGGMLLDITELKTARHALEEARIMLSSIFDNIPAELYLRELDGSFVMMNRWGASFYGKSPQEMIGELASAYDRGEEIEIARKAQELLLTTGKPVTQQYHYTVDGRDVIVLNTMFPVTDSQGRIVRIGGVTTDVTELHTARNQLQRAQESLHQSEKLAALGQLLAGVAHELNNPLAVVLGRAAILQEKLANTPHVASLQKLREAADRCARIVKTFLAMARQTGPRREPVRVNDLIDAALEMTTYALRSSGITWQVARLPTDRQIEVDQDQIVQILINLILNAQQALVTREGHRSLEIGAALSPDGQWMEIAVADNGPGVPDSIAGRIFDPFFTTKAVGQGTGLGLSVCRSMAEAHGGHLHLENTPGGGATFRVVLPAHTGPVAKGDDGTMDVPGPSLSGRILVVDDEVEIAAILADCLTPLGLDCVIASDGRSALQRVAEQDFDAVFCDVSMPGMDGIAFYAQLRAENPRLASHLVFVSGDVLHRNWDSIRSTVDRPIIEKPFDPQQVRDVALQLLMPKGSPT